MLEGLMKGLAVWLYGLLLEIVEFIADSLLEVFNMDLAYFETNVPVTAEIVNIIMAAGWAILIGNLTFQAIKSMMSGIGFEGEDPKILFCRTFVFSFLLLASRQICEIGLGIASRINALLQMPDAVRLGLPPLDVFAIPGSWLLVIIMGIIVMIQIVKFFFEIAERYVVLAVLTILSPLAFGVGGSKNTEDIFKGWARIFGSSCLMMVFNTVFLKLLLSAMSNTPSGAGMLPWMLLVVAIARVARKIDDIVARIGLNTARTGDPISHGGIMYPIMVARTLGQIVSKTAGAGKAAGRTPPTGRQPNSGAAPQSPPPPPSPASGGASHQPQQNGGGASVAANGASGSSAGAQQGTQAGAQSAVSATSPGTEKNAPPSRPPVGIGRKHSSTYSGEHGGEQPDATHTTRGRSSRPPLSVDSTTPDGINKSRMESTSPEESGINKTKDGKSTPPLSVDSRTPDMPRKTGNIGANGLGGGLVGQENRAAQGKRSHKPVNIDIYRDDEPADASRSGSAYRGNSTPPTREASRSGSHIQSVSQTDTNSNTTRRSVQESARVTADSSGVKNASAASGRVSSAGAGRIGGLNQPTEQEQSGGFSQTGGVAVPGSPHRATTASRQERPARVSPSVSNDAPQQSATATDTQSGTRHARENAPSAQARSSMRPRENHASIETGSASAALANQTNNQGTRPMRYRSVERMARNDIQNMGRNVGVTAPPTRPNPDKQPPERGSSLKGGKRP